MRGFFALTTLLLLSYTTNSKAQNSSRDPPQSIVPCFFIFGDSLVDNGNNNDLFSLVKANFWPYGLDFPNGATGRFTNGRTIVDLFAEHLGFSNYMPPFTKASITDYITGVNFASGAAGIRDETGNFLGANIPMNKQIGNFGKVVEQLWEFFKEDTKALQNHINKCIFFSGIGNNDYLNNYFASSIYPTSLLYNPKEFAIDLTKDYLRQLKALYSLGARKVIIPGIGPMGCIPYKRQNSTESQKGSCNEYENNVVQIFNSYIRDMVDKLNNDQQMVGAKFVYLDFYKAFNYLTDNKEVYGFEVMDTGCCGDSNRNLSSSLFTCVPLTKPCANRNKYIFWDGFHPTELAHVIVANKAYNEPNIFTYPINIKQLAEL